MRSSALIVAALLFAGCTRTGNDADYLPLPPKSYWVVTQTLPGEPPPGGDPRCVPGETTHPTELTFTAPDLVTLSTLNGALFFNDGATTPTGRVTPDGALAFFGYDTQYTGRFDDAAHFSLVKKVIRKLPHTNTCQARATAYRYPGPRMCEVTTEEEEAALANDVAGAVEDSHLGELRDFFIAHRLLWGSSGSVTDAGTYAQAGTEWAFVAPEASRYRFTFDDGAEAVVTPATNPTNATLTHPSGWRVELATTDDRLRIALDAAWVVTFDIVWVAGYNVAPRFTHGTLLPMSTPTYVLGRYETPLGKLQWNGDGNELDYSAGGRDLRVITTAAETTLTNGDASKTWTAAERAAYCPEPGRALYAAFPNLLPEMGLCDATTPLHEDRVDCMLVGP